MFYVSRQMYYYQDGARVVEVTAGGSDYAGADMLTPRYRDLGEGQEYTDPREAVEAAIAVCRAWQKAGEINAKVGVGCTGGMGIEMEPGTDAEARSWAEKLYERLPKCSGCPEPLPEKGRFLANDWDGLEYCSKTCADKAAEYDEEQNALDNEENEETAEEA